MVELHNPEPQTAQVLELSSTELSPSALSPPELCPPELPLPKLSSPELPRPELSLSELPPLELSSSQLPPLNSEITATELEQYLCQIERSTRGYIHPKFITFPHARQRLGWKTHMPNSDDKGVFSNFWRQGPGHLNCVAYFST